MLHVGSRVRLLEDTWGTLDDSQVVNIPSGSVGKVDRIDYAGKSRVGFTVVDFVNRRSAYRDMKIEHLFEGEHYLQCACTDEQLEEVI